MVYELDRLDPYVKKQKTGFVGRIADALSKRGYSVNKFTIDQDSAPVEGSTETPKIVLDSTNGFSGFFEGGKRAGYLLNKAELLNGKTEGVENVFSNMWGSKIVRTTTRRSLMTLFQ